LKIQLLSVGLKLSNPKPGRREAALYLLLMKQKQPLDLSHKVDSDRCDFHLYIPALTFASLLER
jgi:hypothetical protein